MRFLVFCCMTYAMLHSHAARADCPLAFAPPEVRRAASEHYYRSAKRDASPPGQLPVAGRSGDRQAPQASAIAAPRNLPAAEAYIPPATRKQPK